MSDAPQESGTSGPHGAPSTPRDFASVAIDLGWLTRAAADTLSSDAAARGTAPGQLAVTRGTLSAAQADIIETLLHPHESIPGYEILGLIGQGGMGVVYRARQKNLGRDVALKAVLVSQLANPAVAARFAQEATTVARLSHPHIVAAYDFGRSEGRFYFAMELIEGEDVERLVERSGRLTEATAWNLARQAAAGLSHAARIGVVHRDIKPANLLLVEPPAGYPLPAGLPMVKIADFGLAFLAEEAETRTRLTAADTTLGSPHYMAPEQLGADRIDQRADIYALGATVYQMLSGAPPFAGLKLPQILAQKCSNGPTPLRSLAPGLSEASESLVARLMARDPDERPSDYGRVMEEIDALLANAAAPRPSPAHLPDVQPTHAPRSASNAAPLATPSQLNRRIGPVKIALVAGFLIILAASISAGFRFARPAKLVPRDLQTAAWSAPLFDGRTLKGWSPVRGFWTATRDEDDGGVIAGTNGLVIRALPPNDAGEIPALFRLTIVARLHEAAAAEIQFGVAGQIPDAPRNALRITADSFQAGRRTGDSGPFQPLEPAHTRAKTASGMSELRIERQPNLWWIQADGETVAVVNAAASLPEFRIRVEGGPAWFSDIQIDELKSSGQQP